MQPLWLSSKVNRSAAVEVNIPKVSVVMPFFNPGRFFEQAIVSVVAQSLKNWELILVDDGSSDGSRDIAEAYAVRFAGKVRLIGHQHRLNCGPARSRELGMDVARGEYLAFLDSDDVYFPDRLSAHSAILDGKPNVQVVLSPDVYWRSWNIAAPTKLEQRDRVIGFAVQPKRTYEPPSLISSMLLNPGAPICSINSITFRRRLAADLGVTPAEFAMHHEDQMLICKLLLLQRAFVIEEPLSRYRQHAGSLTRGNTAGKDGDGGLHTTFLSWLVSYLSENELNLPDVRQTLQDQVAQMKLGRPDVSVRPQRRRAAVLAVLRRVLPEVCLLQLSDAKFWLETSRMRKRVMRGIEQTSAR